MVPLLDIVASEPKPLSGWPLKISIELDRAHPGYLRYVLAASNLKRQANFLAQAVLQEHGADNLAASFTEAGLTEDCAHLDPLAQIARVLIVARAQDIGRCNAIFGSEGAGWTRLLDRIGDSPLPDAAYRGLISLLRDPQHIVRARGLKQSCTISEVSIEAALRLPLPLVRPEILSRLHSIEQIEQIRIALDLILALVPDARHVEVWQSLACLSPSTSLRTWLARLIEKVPRFEVNGPLPDDSDVTLLSSPAALRDCGARLSNCLKTKVLYVFTGRSIFYEWRGSPGAVVELECLSRRHWSIGGIYGPNNAKVDPATMHAIRAKFERAGVLVAAQFAEAKEINRCSALLGIHDWNAPDLEFEELDFLELEGAA